MTPLQNIGMGGGFVIISWGLSMIHVGLSVVFVGLLVTGLAAGHPINNTGPTAARALCNSGWAAVQAREASNG